MSTFVQQPAYSTVEQVQPQPYPLQGQSMNTGWGQYPQGAYYPPPVQKPQPYTEEILEDVPATTTTTTTTTETREVFDDN